MKKEGGTGDSYYTKGIRSKHLEYLGENGNWHPVESLKTDSQHSEADDLVNKFRSSVEDIKSTSIDNLSDVKKRIDLEIEKLKPQLNAKLAASGYKSYIEGLAEIIKEAKHVDVPTVNAPPPQLHIGVSGQKPIVHLPILQKHIETLKKSTAAAGVDYHHTAELVKTGTFAVTADIENKEVEKIKEVFETALDEGHSKERFIENVAKHTTLTDSHLENIFRTNAMSAHNAGKLRALNMPLVRNAFPYVGYTATHDARTREEHLKLETLGLNGTNIYRVDDPTFLMFRPPWSYNCRCSFYPVTVEQAASKGVLEAVSWLERAKKAAEIEGGDYSEYLARVAPVTAEYVIPPNFSPDPEFSRII